MSIEKVDKYDVIIVGSGISGLNCANKLSAAGLKVLVIEKSDSVGGRIKTGSVNGFKLNRGFHVLLTAYPEVKSTFNSKELNLKKFFPGCLIWTGSSMLEVVDPLKHPVKGIKQLINPIGKLQDYLVLIYLWIILRFGLPTRKGISTNEYFKELGFSDLIITRFLRPFFSGVFLESKLETSVEKFNEVFKYFLRGDVVLPSQGIVSLANQIHRNISGCDFLFNSEVNMVSENEVQLKSGELFESNHVVLAVDLESKNRLLGLGANSKFNRVVNFYFSYKKNNLFPEYKLVLNGSDSGPINNLVFMDGGLPENEKGLISVSIIKSQFFELENLEEAILKQLEEWYSGSLEDVRFMEKIDIRNAVPYQPEIEEYNLKLKNNIYYCGDYCGVASLNTSLKTSRMISEAILSEN